jgi:hypothetical protein
VWSHDDPKFGENRKFSPTLFSTTAIAKSMCAQFGCARTGAAAKIWESNYKENIGEMMMMMIMIRILYGLLHRL